MTDIPDIQRLRALSGVKWSRFDDDVIPAWVADMDLPPAPAVKEALFGMVGAGDLGYNMASFDQSVPRAWADWSERRYGWRPDVERVKLVADTLQPIAAVLSVATQPGDGVVLMPPIYPPFFDLIQQSGRRLVSCPLAEDGWRIDGELLASLIDESTRVIMLCNPQNPTGRVMDAQEMALVADIAREHDLIVISDEIWQDVVYPGATHVPFASISADAAARTVTVTSASKSFNMGGLCTAVMHVGSDAVWEAHQSVSRFLWGPVNALGATAALAAWTHGDSWLEETVELLRGNRDHLADRIASELPDVGFALPQSTYLAWLDFRQSGLGDDPAEHLLQQGRVGLSSGPDFGEQGKGFARLNFATTREVLDEIVDRIVAAIP